MRYRSGAAKRPQTTREEENARSSNPSPVAGPRKREERRRKRTKRKAERERDVGDASTNYGNPTRLAGSKFSRRDIVLRENVEDYAIPPAVNHQSLERPICQTLAPSPILRATKSGLHGCFCTMISHYSDSIVYSARRMFPRYWKT